jgi:transposase
VADKSYSSDKLSEYAYETGQVLMIPQKKNAKRGFCRKVQQKFRKRTYNRRVVGESGFKTLKQRYGSSVNSKSAKAVRSG